MQAHDKNPKSSLPLWMPTKVSKTGKPSPVWSHSTSCSAPTKHMASPSNIIRALLSPFFLLRRAARSAAAGLSGAAYAGGLLAALVVPAAAIGLGLVGVWAEEPLFLRESLGFDYSRPHPDAVLWLHGARRRGGGGPAGVPVGHTVSISVILLMPDSDYNRDVGVFQMTAELLSKDGDVIARSSQPCIMRYRSLPIRLLRTFFIGIPLLLGLSSETQTVTLGILLKHREGKPRRTAAVRVTIIPRAGNAHLPQLYEAEIVVASELPWRKQLVRNWKWTLYVWTSLYVYGVLLVLLLYRCKSLFFPAAMANRYDEQRRGKEEEEKPIDEPRLRVSQEEVSELLRRWRESKRKRRELREFLLREVSKDAGESESSPASGITKMRD